MRSEQRKSSVKFLIMLACTLAAGAATARGQATTQPATESNAAVLQETPANLRTIDLIVGQSRTIDAAWPVKRVSVADPNIADVDVVSPRRIQIQGKSVGRTQVTIWSEAGESWQALLEVRADVTRLQAHLRKVFENSSLELWQAEDVRVG